MCALTDPFPCSRIWCEGAQEVLGSARCRDECSCFEVLSNLPVRALLMTLVWFKSSYLGDSLAFSPPLLGRGAVLAAGLEQGPQNRAYGAGLPSAASGFLAVCTML